MNAQPSLFDAPPKRRKASLQDALDILRARGSLGLTEREWEDIAHRQRLAGRIGELRQEFGDSAIESIYEPNGNGSHHVRYVWRG